LTFLGFSFKLNIEMRDQYFYNWYFLIDKGRFNMRFLKKLLIVASLFIFFCSPDSNDQTRELQQMAAKHDIEDFDIEKKYSDTLNTTRLYKGEGAKEQIFIDWNRNFSFLHQNIYLNILEKEDLKSYFDYRDQHFPDVADNSIGSVVASRYISDGKTEIDLFSWGKNQQVTMAKIMPEYADPATHLLEFSDSAWFKEAHKIHVYNNEVLLDLMENRRIGPIVEGAYYALYCNLDLAEKIGIKIKQFNMSGEDLLGYAKKVYEYNQANNTRIGAIYDASDWVTIFILFEHLFKTSYGFDENYISPNSFTEKNQQHVLNVFKLFERMSQYDPLIHKVAENSWGATMDQILKDEALFYINGTWMYPIWKKMDSVKANRIIPCELPALGEAKFYSGEFFPLLSIPKVSLQKKSALEYLKMITTKDFAEDWVKYTKSPTGLKRHLEASGGIGGDAFDQFISHIDQKYKKNLHLSPGFVFFFGKDIDFSQNFHRLLKGEITAEEGLQWVLDRISETP